MYNLETMLEKKRIIPTKILHNLMFNVLWDYAIEKNDKMVIWFKQLYCDGRITDQDIGLDNIHIGSESYSYYASIAETIYKISVKHFTDSIVREIIELCRGFSKIKEFYESQLTYMNKCIEEFGYPDITADYPYSIINYMPETILYFWSNGYTPLKFRKLTDRIDIMNYPNLRDRICAIYDFDTDFATNQYVVRGIKRTKKRIAEYLNTSDDDQDIARSLIKLLHIRTNPYNFEFSSSPNNINRSNMCVNIFLDEMHYDNSEKDLTVGSAIRIINEVVLCYLQPLYCEAINNMQKNSLTMANRNINNHIHDSLPYKLSDEDNLADCVMYGTDNLESPVSINKKLKEIDINIIINSILWALAIKELDNTIKQFGKNEIITDELTEDAEKAKNDDFIKQTIQKNNELQTQVIALKNKNDLLEKANNDLNQRLTIQYKDSIHSMEAQIASQKSEIAELNSIIDNKEHLIIKLQNEIDRLKQTAIPKDDTAEITPDINGRYVFISTDEVMATKLQSWFPNSIARSSYEITPTNAPVIDKVIVMVTKVKHHDYYKIKQDCKNFGVPIVHCNKQSFSEICKVL